MENKKRDHPEPISPIPLKFKDFSKFLISRVQIKSDNVIYYDSVKN